MIKKVLQIANCGILREYIVKKNSDFDGSFKKVNIIYAENGSGKTTFTQIIKSLGGNTEVLKKRKSFNSTSGIEIRFLDENNKAMIYSRNNWNCSTQNVIVFDTFWVESNIYNIPLGTWETPSETAMIILGQQGSATHKRIALLRNRRSFLRRNLRNNKSYLKKVKTADATSKITKRILRADILLTSVIKEIEVLELELDQLYKVRGELFRKMVNHHLQRFNPALSFSKIKKIGINIVYTLQVSGFELDDVKGGKSYSLKQTLSDGDKSSIAFSVFLATIDLLENKEKYIIVFDDPISSFDNNRRLATICSLTDLSSICQQLFILTHDLYFCRKISDKFRDAQNIKICYRRTGNVLDNHNIQFDSLNEIQKDLLTLYSYIERGVRNESELRDVIRCLRPTIEGIIRIKFFNVLKPNDWLGDMIVHIKNAPESSPFFRLQPILHDIESVNEYSKTYHHGNTVNFEMPIIETELQQYVDTTLKLVQYI